MPTRAQIEASKRRNRERYGDKSMDRYVKEAREKTTIGGNARVKREAKAGPRFRHKPDPAGAGRELREMYDAWGGPHPPYTA